METQWLKIAENLKKTLDSGVFRVWIAPLAATVDGRKVQISAPNQFMADWLRRHLPANLRAASAEVLQCPAEDVVLEIGVGCNKEKPARASNLVAAILPERPAQGELPIRISQPKDAPGIWRHSFADLVTGKSNSIAVAAARDMCQFGQVRTLFVNSGPGLGKTHLAQAVGQALASSGNPVKVAYLTSGEFASRYVAAMRSRDLEAFKQYLCGVDVLLLEDVHFFQRKKAMQEMLLDVVKNLESRGARVIFTSSFPARQLEDIDSQLASHFCSGILTGMERPDFEMRQEILRRKAKSFQVNLPDEICDLLSRRLASDVRQLESCLRNMVFKARLLNSGMSIDLALETLSQYACAETTIDLEGIVRLVCQSFGLTEKQLRSRSRKQEYVQGRNTIFYLARKHTEMSLEDIGNMFNRRHTTVMRSITQVEQELASESPSGRQIARAVSLIERRYGL